MRRPHQPRPHTQLTVLEPISKWFPGLSPRLPSPGAAGSSARTAVSRFATTAALGLAGFGALGCAASSSTILHTPIVQKCQKAGLEACKEMTDGVVQYLDGQTIQGTRHLLAGGARNSSEGRERYALVLEQAQGLRGAHKYRKELAEVVLVLAHAHGDEQSDDGAAPSHIVTAETDLYQARDGTIPAPSTTPDWCSSNFGGDAKCVMVMRGPLFVTDIVSVGLECSGQFASVLRGGSVRGHIEGPFDLHGGRLLLTPADTLVFGQKAPPPAPTPAPVEPTTGLPGAKAKATTATAPPAPVQSASNPPKYDCPFYWSGYVPYRDVE